MSLQYISDSEGKTTGVFIPIQDWNRLKEKYKGIEEEEMTNIPDWQKNEVRERLEAYQQNPAQAKDFDQEMDEIDKNL